MDHLHVILYFPPLLSEIAHGLVVEAGAYEALEGMLNKLDPNDLKEREMVSRALTALEPDGWRGVDYGLREKVGNDLVRGLCGHDV